MVDVIEGLQEDLLRPHLVDDAVHAVAGPSELLGEGVHGDSPPVRVKNQLLGRGVERAGHAGEHGLARVGPVVVLERVPDRLGRAAQAAGDAAADFRQAAARTGEATGAADDLQPLGVRQVRELRAARHFEAMRGHKSLHLRLREPQVPAAVVQHPPAR